MQKERAQLNGIMEPDFLEYLEKTFKRWQQLAEQGVTLGGREIAKLTDTIYGARINSRYGFETVTRREKNEEDQEYLTVTFYKDRKAVEMNRPLYTFSTPVHR